MPADHFFADFDPGIAILVPADHFFTDFDPGIGNRFRLLAYFLEIIGYRDIFVVLKKICAVMSSFNEQEYACQKCFEDAGSWYHACTTENYPVFLISENDYKLAISLLGLVAMLYHDVRIVAFEVMNNHLHLITVGNKDRIETLLEDFVTLMQRNAVSFTACQPLSEIRFHLHHIDDLRYARNAIAYVHRNRFLVDPSVTPFTFRWGSNQLYFNPLQVNCMRNAQMPTTQRWRRNISRRHVYDSMENVMQFDNYVCPLCFCDYALGEGLYRSARHYYETMSKSVEGMSQIAKIIGESVILTDDELYKVMLSIARKSYSSDNISELPVVHRLEIARQLRYEYNAGNKQICRMLKLEHPVVESLLGT